MSSDRLAEGFANTVERLDLEKNLLDRASFAEGQFAGEPHLGFRMIHTRWGRRDFCWNKMLSTGEWKDVRASWFVLLFPGSDMDWMDLGYPTVNS